MNKWNKLLAVLDKVYGFADKKTSEFRKVAQHFDERTNEHVVVIEYRVRRGTKLDRDIQSESVSNNGHFPLIQEINKKSGW